MSPRKNKSAGGTVEGVDRRDFIRLSGMGRKLEERGGTLAKWIEVVWQMGGVVYR